ncbi:MAG: TonB dependent receptor [Chitinophagaceae bacterium]
MKQLFLLTLVTIFSLSLTAQLPAGLPANGGKAPSNIGHIYGKVVDESGKGISDVSIILLESRLDTLAKKSREILLKGMSTSNNGEFSLEDLPVAGTLKLQISATGYKASEQAVSFRPAAGGSMPSFQKNLGKVTLITDVSQLQTVTVTANTSGLKMDIDKKVFNVDKNIVSSGGTALDVMKNVPSVNVDIDGNVALRNATPQIFVDGRPTTLTLEQIVADAIESVEVITNPSAKYDASGGGAGILNIVLKKNRKTGYNGNIRAGIDKRGAVNSGVDFNARQGKINLFGSVNFNQMKGRTTGTTNRLNIADTPQTFINQVNNNRTNGAFTFARAGLDYFVTNRTTLSLAGFRVHGEFKPSEFISINSDSLYTGGTLKTYNERIAAGNRSVFDGKGLTFGLKHLFPKEGEELSVDANYFSGQNENRSFYTTNYYSGGAGTAVTGTERQRILGSGNDQNIILQTDYVNPLSATFKLETGLRAAFRSRENNNNNYLFSDLANDYVLIPSATSNYKNNDNVYAAYASITSSIKNFGYKIGLRAESSNYSGELTGSGQKFSYTYPVSLFPSIFLSQKLKNSQQLQASITRRVNRPNFFQLMPFVDYTDPLNITKGNPDLVPEFTSSMELSYSKTFKRNNTFLASLYYKKTDNLITRYLDKGINPITGQEAIINTYINANSGQSYGTELTTQIFATTWWDFTANVNLYNSKINTGEAKDASQNNMWSWFGKFNNNFKLPANFSMQLSAMYQSKTNLTPGGGGGFGGPPGARGGSGGGPGGGGGFGQAQSASQGYIQSYYAVDIAVKKSFLKNNAASATLSFSDIFRTRQTNQHSESAYFIQDYSRLRDPQMVRLTLAYRFGKIDANLFKRKTQTDGGMQSATEGMQ